MKNISLYLPESFEWIILRAGVTNAGEVDKILAEPENYIDSSQYLSWERLFTDFLVSATKDDNAGEHVFEKYSPKLILYIISRDNMSCYMDTIIIKH